MTDTPQSDASERERFDALLTDFGDVCAAPSGCDWRKDRRDIHAARNAVLSAYDAALAQPAAATGAAVADIVRRFDAVKLQAQSWKQEARTANATIAEIYQICTGATGEPGNWHGAEPVRAALAAAPTIAAPQSTAAVRAATWEEAIEAAAKAMDVEYQTTTKLHDKNCYAWAATRIRKLIP